jgi:ATP phosphoribosyltransferase regulatory subunit HisZ
MKLISNKTYYELLELREKVPARLNEFYREKYQRTLAHIEKVNHDDLIRQRDNAYFEHQGRKDKIKELENKVKEQRNIINILYEKMDKLQRIKRRNK